MMNCLILEDEQPAQDILVNFIDKTPFLKCIGCYNTSVLITPERLQQTDILFLDVQLPELSGLAFLKTIPNPPFIIITTAHAGYAVDAFDMDVVDFLLKPFSFERFFKAANRVRNKSIRDANESGKNIFIYSDKTHYNLSVDDILYIKAEVDYVRIVTEERGYLVLESLRNWKSNMKGMRFIQIHRSYIVNMSKVKKIMGNQIFIKEHVLPIGKKYKDGLMDIVIT